MCECNSCRELDWMRSDPSRVGIIRVARRIRHLFGIPMQQTAQMAHNIVNFYYGG